MSTPIKFSLSNEVEPLPSSMDEWVKRVVAHMTDKALADRDGTLTLNITPTRIDCEYHPAPPADQTGR